MSHDCHPPSLIWLTSIYSLFMFAFTSVTAALVLYQITALHIPSEKAYDIFAAASALFWILPLAGGYLSAKFGYVNAARIGLAFCALGCLLLSAQTHQSLYLGLSLFVIGNAFATPSIWCIVDHCYSKDSALRESGFTLFYLFFNVGAMVGVFLGGYIATNWGFAFEFGLGALCLLGALILLHFAKDKFKQSPGRSISPQVQWSQKTIWGCQILISCIAIPLTLLLFHHTTINNILMTALLVFMVFVLITTASKQKTKFSKNKIFLFLTLALISIIFWSLYSLEPSLLSIYILSNVDTSLMGLQIPAPSFFAFDSTFVFLFGLLLSRFWLYLSRRNKNPTLPVKFASSLGIIGLGFCFLSLTARSMGNSLMPSSYIVFAYAMFALAELFIGPLGIAMVGKLAPEGQEGVMMGFWQLCTGMGGAISGYIANSTHIPSHGESLANSNAMYAHIFLVTGAVSVIAGCSILPFVHKLRRLMNHNKECT